MLHNIPPMLVVKMEKWRDHLAKTFDMNDYADVDAVERGMNNQYLWVSEMLNNGKTPEQICKEFLWGDL